MKEEKKRQGKNKRRKRESRTHGKREKTRMSGWSREETDR